MARQQGTEEPAAASTAAASAAPGKRRNYRKQRTDGHELRTAATAADAEKIASAHNVRFKLTSAIAYHAIREQFLARTNRLLTGLQVLLGTSAVATLLAAWPDYGAWLMFGSASAGVVLLVVDPAGGARDHRALRTRLSGILAGLEEFGDTAENLRSANAGIIRAAGEAPPAYRAVSAIAYNTAVNAFYEASVAESYRYQVGAWRSLLANIWPMRGHNFETRKKTEEKPRP